MPVQGGGLSILVLDGNGSCEDRCLAGRRSDVSVVGRSVRFREATPITFHFTFFDSGCLPSGLAPLPSRIQVCHTCTLCHHRVPASQEPRRIQGADVKLVRFSHIAKCGSSPTPLNSSPLRGMSVVGGTSTHQTSSKSSLSCSHGRGGDWTPLPSKSWPIRGKLRMAPFSVSFSAKKKSSLDTSFKI